MPINHHHIIGTGLLGGGAALVVVSVTHLYRMSELAEKYHDVLAPHLASVPDGGVYSASAEELDQKFSIQITRKLQSA